MRDLTKGIVMISLIWLWGLKADAQIEYTLLAPEVEVACPLDTSGVNYYNLDLNQDSHIDFMIGAEHSYSDRSSRNIFSEYMVFANSDSLSKVSTLAYNVGDTIGVNNTYSNWDVILSILPIMGNVGHWPDSAIMHNTTAYIGLKFFDGNHYHYGWLKLKTNAKSFSIIGYAWNKSADEQIIVGQTQ